MDPSLVNDCVCRVLIVFCTDTLLIVLIVFVGEPKKDFVILVEKGTLRVPDID